MQRIVLVLPLIATENLGRLDIGDTSAEAPMVVAIAVINTSLLISHTYPVVWVAVGALVHALIPGVSAGHFTLLGIAETGNANDHES
jgi:hypothetical protein